MYWSVCPLVSVEEKEDDKKSGKSLSSPRGVLHKHFNSQLFAAIN
jgi:hypothetical protein